MTDQATHLRRIMESGNTGLAELPSVLPQSVPTGRVSYGPLREQPEQIRPRSVAPVAAPRIARAIAVSSGKGGVGKSNLAVNLAVVMSRLGLKVCLLDADLGMANADVLCNVTPRVTLEHVVRGRCRLAEALLLGPGGFRLIPGASGVSALADLSENDRYGLLCQLTALEKVADVILIDCGAGINANVLAFASAAHRAIVVTTPEPTAVMDAYGMIKCLLQRSAHAKVDVITNMVENDLEGKGVFHRMSRVSQTFLNQSLLHLGSVPNDAVVGEAVRERMPFVLYAPDARASQAVWAIGRELAGIQPECEEPGGFFTRLISVFQRNRDKS